MQKKQCLGCKTYFDDDEKLPLQDMFIELKNYSIPIKDNRNKWGLLRAIIAFLNAKGGTLYIGVNDKDGGINGCQLTRKEQDQFKLFVKHLVEKIYPSVDLISKEQISIQFIPIVKNKIFKSTYVIKIIVHQGNPLRTYCLSQKVQLVKENKENNKIQEYEIMYSWKRHNMGGVVEYKGAKLIEEVQRKASQLPIVANTFHEDCNPQPLTLQVEITKIGFSGVSREPLRKKLQAIFHQQMKKFQIIYELTYDIDNQVLLIELNSADDFKEVNNYILKNIDSFNQNDKDYNFGSFGAYLDFYRYSNVVQGKGKGKKAEKDEKVNNYSERTNKILTKSTENKYKLTFTHINTKLIKQLRNYLKERINKQGIFSIQSYQNTLDLIFANYDDFQKYKSLCKKHHQKQLNDFGFKNQIIWGESTGNLHIYNYRQDRKKQLIDYLYTIMGKSIWDIEVKKNKNRNFIEIKIQTKELACHWLDKLLTDHQFKSRFQIQGSERGNAKKIKIYLQFIDQ